MLSSDQLEPPSRAFLFGTDDLGRDILSRIIWGGRVSLPFSFVLIIASLVVGALVGGIAGFLGGWVDEILMRLTDLVFAFPTIVLAMAVLAAIGPGLRNAIIALIAVFWPTYARVSRSLVRSTMESDYVLSSRLLGASAARALVADILPNVAGPVLILAALDIGNAILLISALSFLGLGAQPPAPEWGSMLSTGTVYIYSWWVSLFPGLAIFTTVFGFNLIGDGLRDWFDPRTVRS